MPHPFINQFWGCGVIGIDEWTPRSTKGILSRNSLWRNTGIFMTSQTTRKQFVKDLLTTKADAESNRISRQVSAAVIRSWLRRHNRPRLVSTEISLQFTAKLDHNYGNNGWTLPELSVRDFTWLVARKSKLTNGGVSNWMEGTDVERKGKVLWSKVIDYYIYGTCHFIKFFFDNELRWEIKGQRSARKFLGKPGSSPMTTYSPSSVIQHELSF